MSALTIPKLANYRKQIGMSQEQFADAAKCSLRTVQRIEGCAEHSVNFTTANKICDALREKGLQIEFTELVVIGPNGRSNGEQPLDESATAKLLEWLTYGDRASPRHVRMPAHPELFYRLTGGWPGWGDFLGLDDPSAISDARNEDEIDNAAYDQFLIACDVIMRLFNGVAEQKGSDRIDELKSEATSVRRRLA